MMGHTLMSAPDLGFIQLLGFSQSTAYYNSMQSQGGGGGSVVTSFYPVPSEAQGRNLCLLLGILTCGSSRETRDAQRFGWGTAGLHASSNFRQEAGIKVVFVIGREGLTEDEAWHLEAESERFRDIHIVRDAIDLCSVAGSGPQAVQAELDLRLAFLASTTVVDGMKYAPFLGVGRQDAFLVRSKIEAIFSPGQAGDRCGSWDNEDIQVLWGCQRPVDKSIPMPAIFRQDGATNHFPSTPVSVYARGIYCYEPRVVACYNCILLRFVISHVVFCCTRCFSFWSAPICS